jgi:hypothetical protein
MDCDLREWTGLMLHLNISKIGFARRYPLNVNRLARPLARPLDRLLDGAQGCSVLDFLSP